MGGTRLQRDVRRGARLWRAPQIAKGHDLGMLFTGPGMESFCNDFTILDEDTTNHGVWMRFAPSLFGQLQGLPENSFVLGRDHESI